MDDTSCRQNVADIILFSGALVWHGRVLYVRRFSIFFLRDAIRQTYGTRCAICLVGLPRGQCAHLLDQGADQVRINSYTIRLH